MAIGYIPLSPFKAPGPLDFSGLNEGLDALSKSIERNRLLEEQKAIGEGLRKPQAATSSSSPQYGSQTNKLLSSPAGGQSGSPYSGAIAGIETPNFKEPYQARGPVVQSGDRAYGKYQVMGANIGPWTREILGREMSPEEFLASPEAQEKVFEGKFGQYAQKHGPDGAASMWFTGRPSAPNAQARGADGQPLGITGREYVEKFRAGLGGGQQPTNALISQPSAGPNYSAGMDVALRQGNLGVALDLANAQRQQEATAYERARQGRQDAQTSDLRDVQIQQGRQELQQAAQLKFASVAQAIENQKDPAQRDAMWRKLVAVNPRIAQTLQQYGVDPNDSASGIQFLIAEARGISPAKPTVQEVQGRLVERQPDGSFKEVYAAPPKPTQMMAADRKEVYESDEAVRAGKQALGTLDKALELNKTAFEGLLPATRAWVGSLFGNKASVDTRELRNVVTGLALEQLRLTFGGAPTEGERQILIDLQGSLDEDDKVRERIFNRAKEAVQRRVEFNRTQAQAIRSGEYFQPGFDPNAAAASPQQQNASAHPPRPQGITDAQILEEAQKQIYAGKDPAAVQQRLEAWGVKR